MIGRGDGGTVTDDPTMLPAEALLAAYRARRLSPVEVASAVFARIRRHDGAFGAMTRVDEENALAAARASEARWAKAAPAGALDGVPATIKGLVLAKGWPTLRGSKLVDPNQAWSEDAPATARLREAGAVLIGQTATPEFGWKGLTDSPLTGITRNPWNPAHTPGGSSGGAAVAAACGFGALHVGTDGAGSIRIPAAFTGIPGIKPNFGRVPAYPASPFRLVSHVGPMARTVRDCALMLNVLQRPDARDPSALAFEDRDFLAGIDDGVKGMRIGFSPTLGGARVHPEVAARVADSAKALAALGAIVEEEDPKLPAHADAMLTIWSGAAAKLVSMQPPARRGELDPGLVAMAAIGAGFTLNDWFDADAVRMALGRAMAAYLAHFDVLLTPTMPTPPLPAGLDLNEAGQRTWMDWSPFTWPFNMTGQPAMSVPCGFAAGLPVGLQIVGRMFDEAGVLRVARAVERAHPWPFPRLA